MLFLAKVPESRAPVKKQNFREQFSEFRKQEAAVNHNDVKTTSGFGQVKYPQARYHLNSNTMERQQLHSRSDAHGKNNIFQILIFRK
jgi:hypothetical protein